MKIFFYLVVAYFVFLLLTTLVTKVGAAPRPPVLVVAFNDETRRVNASPEDIIQYEAQVWQESAWRQFAESRYAQGPTQFTPGTRSDWYPRTSPSCEGVHWSDPNCAFRAQILYMTVIGRSYWASPDKWALSQAAYNGGPGWIKRERRLCAATPGCDPRRWYRHVEKALPPKARSSDSCKENRDYPIRIRSPRRAVEVGTYDTRDAGSAT